MPNTNCGLLARVGVRVGCDACVGTYAQHETPMRMVLRSGGNDALFLSDLSGNFCFPKISVAWAYHIIMCHGIDQIGETMQTLCFTGQDKIWQHFKFHVFFLTC